MTFTINQECILEHDLKVASKENSEKIPIVNDSNPLYQLNQHKVLSNISLFVYHCLCRVFHSNISHLLLFFFSLFFSSFQIQISLLIVQ